MRTLSLIVVFVSMAVMGGPASAQTSASPTPPPGPLLNKAPDFAAWTIISQRVPAALAAAEPKPASPKLPQVVTTITKTGHVRHSVIRHRVRKIDDGSGEEVWQEDQYVVTHESVWKGAQLDFNATSEDTPMADFPEFGWISAANFVGVQQVQGAACLAFEATIIVGGGGKESGGEGGKGNDASMPGAQLHERGFIDLKTRLPKFLLNGDILSSYTFETAPGAMLVLPPADQAMIDSYLNDNAARLRAPQPP